MVIVPLRPHSGISRVWRVVVLPVHIHEATQVNFVNVLLQLSTHAHLLGYERGPVNIATEIDIEQCGYSKFDSEIDEDRRRCR